MLAGSMPLSTGVVEGVKIIIGAAGYRNKNATAPRRGEGDEGDEEYVAMTSRFEE
jgi:hypothetical protein